MPSVLDQHGVAWTPVHLSALPGPWQRSLHHDGARIRIQSGAQWLHREDSVSRLLKKNKKKHQATTTAQSRNCLLTANKAIDLGLSIGQRNFITACCPAINSRPKAEDISSDSAEQATGIDH